MFGKKERRHNYNQDYDRDNRYRDRDNSQDYYKRDKSWDDYERNRSYSRDHMIETIHMVETDHRITTIQIDPMKEMIRIVEIEQVTERNKIVTLMDKRSFICRSSLGGSIIFPCPDQFGGRYFIEMLQNISLQYISFSNPLNVFHIVNASGIDIHLKFTYPYDCYLHMKLLDSCISLHIDVFCNIFLSGNF